MVILVWLPGCLLRGNRYKKINNNRKKIECGQKGRNGNMPKRYQKSSINNVSSVHVVSVQVKRDMGDEGSGTTKKRTQKKNWK